MTNEFLEYAVQQIHPKLLEWYSKEQISTALLDDVTRDTITYFAPDFATDFAGQFSVLGIKANQFSHRLLEVNDLRLIAGIRFFSGDIKHPFVEVARISRPLESNADQQALTVFLQEEFAEFQAINWRIFQSSHLLYQFPDCKKDQRIVAGSIQQIKASPRPEQHQRIKLQAASNLEFYPRYQSIYQNLYTERSWQQDVARAETLEDMKYAVENDQVFEIFVDHSWAGIVSATRDTINGLQGWYMLEVVLDAPFRNQGLGVAVQRALLEQLESTQTDCLFGTIGAANTPMLKTAARVGRIDLGGYFWINF